LLNTGFGRLSVFSIAFVFGTSLFFWIWLGRKMNDPRE
jgi:hypothetical protein